MFLFLCGPALHVNGQSPPPQSAIRFANVCSISTKVFFTNDNRKVRPDGFGPGDYTGAFGTPAGAHRFALSSPGTKGTEVTITLQPNTATTIIAFAKPVFDPVTRQNTMQLQLFPQPDAAREKGKHFFLLYVSPRPAADVVVNGQPRNVPALRQINVDNLAHGNIKIESDRTEIANFAAQQNGNFLAIIFDKPDGTLTGMLMPDYD
jgi:hypothetical protein